MAGNRYVVTIPGQEGQYAWYNVTDVQNNQTVVTIYKSVPGADVWAERMAKHLNDATGPQRPQHVSERAWGALGLPMREKLAEEVRIPKVTGE